MDGRWEWTPCYSLYTWAPQTLGLVDILAFKTCWCLAGINYFFNQISCSFMTFMIYFSIPPPLKKKKKCFLRRRPGLFPFLGGCGCLGGWHSVLLVGKLLHLYFLGVAVGILFYLQASLYFSCCFFKTVTMKTQFQPHSWSVNNCRLNNSGNVAESQGTAWWVPSWNWRWKKSKRWTSCQSSFLVTIMSCTSLLLPLFSSGKLFYNCFPQMVIEGIYFHL